MDFVNAPVYVNVVLNIFRKFMNDKLKKRVSGFIQDNHFNKYSSYFLRLLVIFYAYYWTGSCSWEES
jgi:hypothetical protein